jgi:hypothetical protein
MRRGFISFAAHRRHGLSSSQDQRRDDEVEFVDQFPGQKGPVHPASPLDEQSEHVPFSQLAEDGLQVEFFAATGDRDNFHSRPFQLLAGP